MLEKRIKANMKVWIAVSMLLALAGSLGSIVQGGGAAHRIAFQSARDGNNEIYLIDADGGSPFRVTNHPASDLTPDISPNGREIVFTSNRGGNNDIWVTDLAGNSARNLSKNPTIDGWPRWSPNGQWVAFHSDRDGNFNIYVTRADGSGDAIRLTDYSGLDQYPDWSPDGQEIAFRRDHDIYVIDLRSGDLRRLTSDPAIDQMSAWSPNGKYLAFTSFRNGYCSVFRMNADGSDQIDLTPKDAAGGAWCSRAPSWSVNGREILFMSFRPSTGGDVEIFVMNLDGTDVRRLTNSPGEDSSPRARQ